MERQPCAFQETCRLRDSKLGCREDIHHLYFPARLYRGIAKVFRELDENKVLTCRALHEEAHATQRPPEFPSLEVMREAINRAKGGENDTAA